ncbi:hypothetical protein [uncultured Hymenobacter sp.]|uniref:hypothetical protein n=1 Tax=uncultured Hymenobacter sp. TaxID=170016 RepID=UPI0035CB6DCE
MPQPKRQNLYLGKAGQFAAMAECLMRGFNVAIPEVDVGDDLFVVNDQSGNYRRIQVKTVTATRRSTTYSAQFQVPLPQLQQVFVPDLVYVFASRFPTGWGPFLVIPRDTLLALHQLKGLGTIVNSKTGAPRVQFYVSFADDGSVSCAQQSLSRFINQFEGLPDLVPSDDLV